MAEIQKIPRGQTSERRAYMKTYVESHPRPDRKAYKAAYDMLHAERIREYRAANQAKLKAAKAAWYKANRESVLVRVKARATANAEQVSAYHAEHYEANAEKIKANVKAYRAKNPEKKAHLENQRRARKAGNGGSHTLAERLQKFAALGNVCFYCGCGGSLTIDHDLPLARGGTDDIDNILPACRSCNSRKHKRTAQEFIEYLKTRRTNHQRTGGVGGDSAGTR